MDDSERSLSVLLVDDHPIITDALEASLVALDVFQKVDKVKTLEASIDALSRENGYDLVILDLNLGKTTGTESVKQMREKYPDTPIVIFSGDDRTDAIADSFELGVQGYIPKSRPMAYIVRAVKEILAGGIFIPEEAIQMLGFQPTAARAESSSADESEFALSPRQHEVLSYSLQGLPNKVIAARLGIAEGTVKSHLNTIYRVFGVRSRARLILKARAYGVT